MHVLRSLATVTLLAAALAARAETVALLPASGINVAEPTLAAAQEVLRGHLERARRFTLRQVPGAASLAEPTPREAADQGKMEGAEVALVLRMAQLGSTLRVKLVAYRTGDAARIFWDELAAAGPNDLDPVLQRLAQSFAGSGTARANAEIDTVTEKEAEPLRKLAATRSFGLRLGSAGGLGRAPGTTAAAMTGAGVFWLYDARELLADLSFDLFAGSGDYLVALGLGAYWPVLRTNVTPYLGAGLRFTWSKFGGEGAHGLTPHAAVGLLVGRLWSLQLRAEVDYFVNAYTEDVAGGAAYHAHGVAGQIGIGF